MARVKVWKEALLPGTWVTTKGQVFHCGPADLRYFHDRTRDMLAKGACIPWCYEHQHDDGTELSASDLLARWAKNTGGHIHDVRLRSPNGPLDVEIDVDEADIPRLAAIKYCSPDIRPNWRDRNGPAVDELGPFWPGQSIAHLAITPMPVQYPQTPFQFDKSAKGFSPVSLSAAGVAVCLSSATYHEDPMADEPKPDETPTAAIPDEMPGEDLEGGGAITEPPPEPTDSAAQAVMHDLAAIATELGVQLHSSAHEDLLTFAQHFATAVKTHLATKGKGEPQETPAPEEQPNQDQTANYDEPEVAESPPIQMSATTTPETAPNPTRVTRQPTAHEQKLAAALLKQNSANLMGRIGNLHARGFIDNDIRRELEAKVCGIRLSASDLSDDGEIKPSGVALEIAAYERLAKTGKPGSFAKPSAKPAPPAKVNKPISTAVALSAADEEEVVDPPYGAAPDQPRPVVPAIVNRMSNGRYDSYLKNKNGA